MNKSERKYIAVSMKHSTKNCFMLWGYKRTLDQEDRCFSNYTAILDKCELYSEEEFFSHYKRYPVIDEKITSITAFWKQYKEYDTVLVSLDIWTDLMTREDIKNRNRRKKKGVNILSKGDKVVMHTCIEAKENEGKIWECDSDSWDNYGTELVMLKGFSGGFWTKYLQKVNI